jgi:hypothetical protein
VQQKLQQGYFGFQASNALTLCLADTVSTTVHCACSRRKHGSMSSSQHLWRDDAHSTPCSLATCLDKTCACYCRLPRVISCQSGSRLFAVVLSFKPTDTWHCCFQLLLLRLLRLPPDGCSS